MFDVYKIREDFPILDRKVNNTDLVYFDNAETSKTTIKVIAVSYTHLRAQETKANILSRLLS